MTEQLCNNCGERLGHHGACVDNLKDQLTAKDARIKELSAQLSDACHLAGNYLAQLTALQQQFSWRKVSEGRPTVNGSYWVTWIEYRKRLYHVVRKDGESYNGADWEYYNDTADYWLGPLPKGEQQEVQGE